MVFGTTITFLTGLFPTNAFTFSIKICVPEVIDLKTAQIAIHEFRHAHDLYLNKFFNDNLEQEAMSEEQKFKENYYKLKKHYHK